VRPGSPSAHSLSSGDTIPVTQTSTAVQLDQILTSLQAPDRANLQKLLEG
jgi:phospholipid/cholesterol/gamma-HCH transport system substrate-binding protein